jgi:hypothetical protein
MARLQEKVFAWVESNPPPAGTVFSAQRAGKLLLALFAITALGSVPKLLYDAFAKPKPEHPPVELKLTMQDLEAADQRGELGSGFKRLLEMRKQQAPRDASSGARMANPGR